MISGFAVYVAIQNQRYSNNSEQQGTPPANAAISIEAHDKHPPNNADKTQGNPPRWYGLFAWPDSITAWVILLTLLAIAEQAQESAKATKAMQVSVETSRDAERAWIVGNIEHVPDFSTEDKGNIELLWILPVFRNYGKTPGRIITIRARSHYVPKGEQMPIEPVFSVDGTSEFNEEIVLVPGISVQPVSIGISPREIWKAQIQGSQLLIYGVVNYLDIYGRQFWSRFCYVYHTPHGFHPLPPGFYVGGPSGYNNAK